MRPLRLVLLPGFDGTGELFAPLQAEFNDWPTTVVAYADFASLEEYLAHAESLIPKNEPVCLVAESFSGPIALHLMQRAQRDYRCAMLSTTFAKPPLGLVLSLAQKLRLASFVVPAVSERILRMFCLNGVRDLALLHDIVAVVRSISQQTIQSRLLALTQMDASGFLADIKQPIDVLTAAKDRILRQRFSTSLITDIPDVRHHVIDGPHLLLQAQAPA
ncbi:MAG: alpha/beta hydrolase, partial [Pseudomonadota bacterium]